MLGETLGFIADVLKEFESGRSSREFYGSRGAKDKNFFLLFRESGDFYRWGVQFFQSGMNGMELAESAVDEDEVGPKLFAGEGVFIPA